MIVIGIEGVGGSGKTSLIQKLIERSLNRQPQIISWKVGGLGDTPREKYLKEIMGCREQLLIDNEATDKQVEDKERDIIFRLALRHQARQLKFALNDGTGTKPDIVLLDRTPFMSWVYSAARKPDNTYLTEIWTEASNICNSLGVERVFLLDVDPTTAYARLIARVAIGTGKHPEVVCEQVSSIVGFPPKSQETILQKVKRLITAGSVVGKPYSRWDYIPWQVMINERLLYRQVFTELTKATIPTTVIDAERPLLMSVVAVENELARLYRC